MSLRFPSLRLAPLRALLVVLLLIGGSACGGFGSKWKRIDLVTVKEILPEMLTAEAAFNQKGLSDSLRMVGFQAILDRYGYTLADWDSSLVWYGRHQIVEYQKLYESASLVLESRQARLQGRVDRIVSSDVCASGSRMTWTRSTSCAIVPAATSLGAMWSVALLFSLMSRIARGQSSASWCV